MHSYSGLMVYGIYIHTLIQCPDGLRDIYTHSYSALMAYIYIYTHTYSAMMANGIYIHILIQCPDGLRDIYTHTHTVP